MFKLGKERGALIPCFLLNGDRTQNTPRVSQKKLWDVRNLKEGDRGAWKGPQKEFESISFWKQNIPIPKSKKKKKKEGVKFFWERGECTQ